MKILILAAGYGTRLYPLTKDVPKALLPIKGAPVIEYILENLKDVNSEKIYIVTNDRFAFRFKRWLQNLDSKNITELKDKIEIVNDRTTSDEDKLGAIGDINFVIQEKNINDDLMVLAADNLFNFDLSNFVAFSKENESPTIGITTLENKNLVSQYGVVELDTENKIKRFKEKPENPSTNKVAIGIYFLPRISLSLIKEYLRKGNNPDAIGFLIRWTCENYRVYCYNFEGKWFDIGSKEGYKLAGGDLI